MHIHSENAGRPKRLLSVAILLLFGLNVHAGDRGNPADILADSLKAVRFFESSYYAPDFENRVYRTHFVQSWTRYINWELRFEMEPLGYRLDFRVVAHCRNEAGKTIFKQKKDSYIEKDWKLPWTSLGYGSKAGGSWEPGTYTVTFEVKGRQIAQAAFTVLADAEAGLNPATIWDGSVPLLPGARVIKLTEMNPAATLSSALVESPWDKLSTWNYYRYAMPARGWVWDKGLAADEESGSLENENIWGLLNFTRDGCSLTLIVLSDQKTGGKATQVDVSLVNPRAGLPLAELVRRIPRVTVDNSRMGQRFTNTEWALTVKSARVEGKEIVKVNHFNNRRYVFYSGSPELYLVRVTVELERLNGKPINKDFLVRALAHASDGKTYACVGAGSEGEYAEYYDMRKGGMQSLLMPTIAKSDLEYVFALPLTAAATAFEWPGFEPVPIQVE
ncbi:MAG: hypothetical protein RB296_00650 [Acidobacteriota bacterium]|nr:hypothetical protein [Acidobacteriota bacterium]